MEGPRFATKLILYGNANKNVAGIWSFMMFNKEYKT